MNASTEFNVLGIDPSLNRTAFCHYSDKGFDFFTVIPKELRGCERLTFIFNETLNWISTRKCDFDAIAIENYSYGSMGKLADLAEAGGIIKVCLAMFTNTVVKPTPSQLKKFVLGNGSLSRKVSKPLMIKKANEALAEHGQGQLVLQTDDEADALGLAVLAHKFMTKKCVNRYEAEVIKAVENSKETIG